MAKKAGFEGTKMDKSQDTKGAKKMKKGGKKKSTKKPAKGY